MSDDPIVTNVPADRDGKVIHLAHGGTVQRYTVVGAQLAIVRLNRAVEKQAELARPRGDGMTEAQCRHLHALLGERGIRGDARHPVLTELVGREITSASQLSKDEASRAIDALFTGRPLQSTTEGAF